MSVVSPITFRAGGGESTGSPAYITSVRQETPVPNCPAGNTNCDSVNFRGRDNEKGNKALGISLGILGAAALIVVGMAYAHKTNAIDKLNDGKFKDLLKKVEPFSKKCEEWCLKIKTKCTEFWDKIRKSGDKK